MGAVWGIGQTAPFQPTVSTSTTAVLLSSLTQTDSNGSGPAVAFSRPSTISVFSLNGLGQREQRSRASSAAYSNYDSESAGAGTNSSRMVNCPVSAAESELWRERGGPLGRNRADWRTVGVSSGDNGADHQPATARDAGGSAAQVKAERRTVTEIFSEHLMGRPPPH